MHYDAPLKRLTNKGRWRVWQHGRCHSLAQQLDIASKRDKVKAAKAKDDAGSGEDTEKKVQKKGTRGAQSGAKGAQATPIGNGLLSKLFEVMRAWDALMPAPAILDAASALEQLERQQAALGVTGRQHR